VRDFITDLAWRGEDFDPERPDFDNSLKVFNDGRNVSMDERMANLIEALDDGRATEKMGTGTNIQDRAVALHHLEVPWRPAGLGAAGGSHPAPRQQESRGADLQLRHRGHV